MRVARVPGVPRAPRGRRRAGQVRARVAEALDRCLLGEVAGPQDREPLQGVPAAHGAGRRARPPAAGADPRRADDRARPGADHQDPRDDPRSSARDRAVLLSTHILPEVEAVCDRVLIIDRGRIVAEGTPAELRAKLAGTPVVRAAFKGSVAGARGARRRCPACPRSRSRSAPGETRARIACLPGADPREDDLPPRRREGLGAARARRARRYRSRTSSCA